MNANFQQFSPRRGNKRKLKAKVLKLFIHQMSGASEEKRIYLNKRKSPNFNTAGRGLRWDGEMSCWLRSLNNNMVARAPGSTWIWNSLQSLFPVQFRPGLEKLGALYVYYWLLTTDYWDTRNGRINFPAEIKTNERVSDNFYGPVPSWSQLTLMGQIKIWFNINHQSTKGHVRN